MGLLALLLGTRTLLYSNKDLWGFATLRHAAGCTVLLPLSAFALCRQRQRAKQKSQNVRNRVASQLLTCCAVAAMASARAHAMEIISTKINATKHSLLLRYRRNNVIATIASFRYAHLKRSSLDSGECHHVIKILRTIFQV